MVPSEGLTSFPMNVVAGCGSRRDLGLMTKPAASRVAEVDWMCVRRAVGEDAISAISSRYWMVRGGCEVGEGGGKDLEMWWWITHCAIAGACVQPKGRERRV